MLFKIFKNLFYPIYYFGIYARSWSTIVFNNRTEYKKSF